MAQKPVIHAADHLPHGSDPLPGQLGLIAGYANLDLAVTNPGGLLFRYRCDDASGDLTDTAGHTGGPYPLTLHENTAGVDGSDVWDSAHAPTYAVLDHDAFGTADDGCIRFNYNQQHAPTSDYSLAPLPPIYPGAWFERDQSGFAVWGGSTGNMRSISLFFKPGDGVAGVHGAIIGNSNTWSDVEQGFNGWALYFDNNDNTLHYRGTTGFAGVSFVTPGALTVGQWYHAVITLDPATHLWSFYLNAALVDTFVQSAVPSPNSGLQIGAGYLYGSFNEGWRTQGFFYGEVDEVDGYSVTLTPADISAIFAARDAGYGITSEVVHIGAGPPGDPANVHSFEADGVTPVPDGDALVADGDGGTEWVAVVGTPGADGPPGPTGPAGPTGPSESWFVGTGAPSSGLGITSDQYLDTATGNVYEKRLTVPSLHNAVGTSTSSGTSHGVTLPTLSAGDELLLLVVSALALASLPSAPSGWSVLVAAQDMTGTPGSYVVFRKTATGSEGSSVTLSTGSTTTLACAAASYTGGALDVSAGTTHAVSSPMTMPAVTTTLTHDRVIQLLAVHGTSLTFTPAAGFTNRVNQFGSGGTNYAELFDADQAAAGTTGTTGPTYTVGGGIFNNAGMATVALKPSGAASWVLVGNIIGPAGANGATGATGAAGAPGHDGYFPPFTADPVPAGPGYGYLNTATGTLNVWDGSSWWRTPMTQDIGGSGAFDPIYDLLTGGNDVTEQVLHPFEIELFN